MIELAVATVIFALATKEFALALTKLGSATIELALAAIDFALATVILALARLKVLRKDLCLKETTIKHQTAQADLWVKFLKLHLAETPITPGINANICHKPHKAAALPKLWQKFAFIHSTAETQLTA